MNQKVRTETLEVLLNPAELGSLTELCASLGGIAKSTFVRGLINSQVRTHRMPASRAKEPRRCPGAGRMASRGGAPVGMRRHL